MDPIDPLDPAHPTPARVPEQNQDPAESAPPSADSAGSPSSTAGPIYPAPKDSSKHARRVTREQYDAVYADWLAGMRSSQKLAEKYGFSWETVRKLVKYGSRLNGWPSFPERRVAEDEAVKAARAQAAPAIAQMMVDDYEKVRRENLSIVAGMKAGTSFIVRKYIDAARSATFVKTRKVRDKQGNMITIEVPMDAAEAADVGRTLMQLVEGLARVESFAMGGPDSRVEVSQSSLWDQMSDAQVQWVVDHHGQLPPDIDPTALLGQPPARDGRPDLKVVK